MRIAIYHNLPSGGGKRALYEMTRRLSSRHEIDSYTLSCAEHDFCDLRPYVRRQLIFPFRPLPLARRPFGRLNQGLRTIDLLRLRSLQRHIASIIDAAKYDVVFVHNCQFGQSPAILPYLTTPAAYYCAEPPRGLYEPEVCRPYLEYSRLQKAGNLVDPFPALYRKVLRQTDQRNVRSAALVLVNSAYSRESLYRVYGIFAQIGYLGVDTGRFRPQPGERSAFVLSVGALNPRKGFDFLIRSLALLPEQSRPQLIIVSNFADPREKEYLMSLAKSLDVILSLLQNISDGELVTLYNRALLTLYAPVMEPFGFVPLESMACETPVVGVNEAGIRETVRHGEIGLLTERDPWEFAQAIAELLNDADRRRAFAARGRNYVEEEWQWDRSVALLERYLSRLCA